MAHGFGIGELTFLLGGLGWTLLLSAIGFLGGGVFGLGVALGRSAPRPAPRRAMTMYVGVFQGTPLLLQLFCVFYGLGLIGIFLPA